MLDINELRKGQDFFIAELQIEKDLRDRVLALGGEGSPELAAVEMMIRNNGEMIRMLDEIRQEQG